MIPGFGKSGIVPIAAFILRSLSSFDEAMTRISCCHLKIEQNHKPSLDNCIYSFRGISAQVVRTTYHSFSEDCDMDIGYIGVRKKSDITSFGLLKCQFLHVDAQSL